jgi:hypothetical protein
VSSKPDHRSWSSDGEETNVADLARKDLSPARAYERDVDEHVACHRWRRGVVGVAELSGQQCVRVKLERQRIGGRAGAELALHGVGVGRMVGPVTFERVEGHQLQDLLRRFHPSHRVEAPCRHRPAGHDDVLVEEAHGVEVHAELESKREKILRRIGSDVDADHLLRMLARDVAARHGADARWRKQIMGAQGCSTDGQGQINPVTGRVWIQIEEAVMEIGLLVEDGPSSKMDDSSQGSSQRSSQRRSTLSQRPLMRSDWRTSTSRISSSSLQMAASWCSITEDRGRRDTTAIRSRRLNLIPDVSNFVD